MRTKAMADDSRSVFKLSGDWDVVLERQRSLGLQCFHC